MNGCDADEQRAMKALEEAGSEGLINAFCLVDDDDDINGGGGVEMDESSELASIAAALSVCDSPVEPAKKAAANVKICKVCGKNPAQKNQVFCSSPCGADVRGATRQAKEQGEEAFRAFQALRKSNPDEFVAAIHIFRAKCASAGRGYRRPQFQWVRYHMAIILASRLQTGTKCLWLTKFAYAHNKKMNEGRSEAEAFASFERELNTLPAGRISADRSQIFYPIESFVICMEEKAQEEQTQYGTKETYLLTSLPTCV